MQVMLIIVIWIVAIAIALSLGSIIPLAVAALAMMAIHQGE